MNKIGSLNSIFEAASQYTIFAADLSVSPLPERIKAPAPRTVTAESAVEGSTVSAEKERKGRQSKVL